MDAYDDYDVSTLNVNYVRELENGFANSAISPVPVSAAY